MAIDLLVKVCHGGVCLMTRLISWWWGVVTDWCHLRYQAKRLYISQLHISQRRKKGPRTGLAEMWGLGFPIRAQPKRRKFGMIRVWWFCTPDSRNSQRARFTERRPPKWDLRFKSEESTSRSNMGWRFVPLRFSGTVWRDGYPSNVHSTLTFRPHTEWPPQGESKLGVKNSKHH